MKKMKIGILNAIPEEGNGSTIDWGITPLEIYIQFFESVNAPFEYQGYGVSQGEFPESIDACDAYLVTGSPQGVYDSQPWIAELIKFIQDSYQAKKKLVGICFGHQVLAHALGGHAERSEKGWGLGLATFKINAHKPWMTEAPERSSLYFVHQDQVMQLPPEAELLGSSEFCPNLFYTIDNQVFGIQGHPEFTPKIMQKMMHGREEKVGLETHKRAMDSIASGTPDNRLFAEWTVDFLRAAS